MAAKTLTRYTPLHKHELADLRGRLGLMHAQVVSTIDTVTVRLISESLASHVTLSVDSAEGLRDALDEAIQEAKVQRQIEGWSSATRCAAKAGAAS